MEVVTSTFARGHKPPDRNYNVFTMLGRVIVRFSINVKIVVMVSVMLTTTSQSRCQNQLF